MEIGNVIVAGFNLLMLVVVVGALSLLRRSKHNTTASVVLLFVIAGFGFAGAFLFPVGIFYKVVLLVWVVFVYLPLFLLGSVYLLYRQNRRLALVSVMLTAVILLVYVDAFLIEPHWLQVTRLELPAPNLPTPVRIAIVTDIQTDELGQYEEDVLRIVKAETPDLILFGGDYLALEDHQQFLTMSDELNEMLHKIDLDAPLGIYAVRGNIDWREDWQDIFSDLPVYVFNYSERLDLGLLVLTGLSLADSFSTQLQIEDQGKYHIVLGHSPNFSLGQVNADLLIAGHTHGGQVQVPFLGPILTLSEVPRSWASGVTAIEPGKVLVVSRGIGMERAYVPRMRFLCRPELIILDLIPAE